MKDLTIEAIADSVRSSVSVQPYGKKTPIEGVKVFEVKRMSGEDGTFEELLRVDDKGFLELVPEMQVRQINRSKLLPGSIKAWHLHFKQEDLWYVPPEDHMILGLWDVRSDSPTKEQKMKIVLGNGISRLVLVPRGVAHGVVNVARRPGTIFYFVNNQFNLNEPDERRLPWDKLGASFWEIEKG